MIFVSAVACILANKSNSIVGVAGLIGVALYGAVIGWAIALATSKTIEFNLSVRLLGSLCWLTVATGLYMLVFRKVSYADTATMALRGLLCATLPAVIVVGRGLMPSRR
jgi:hypothetical protein